MVKWEYKTVLLYSPWTLHKWDVELNYWGAEGWELISMAVLEESTRAVFKRPLPIEIPKQEAWTDKGLT